MTVNDAFVEFKSNLELPDKAFTQASEAQQEIRRRLGGQIEIYDSFLAGSYARHTKIDPLKDIDIIFVRNQAPVGLSSGNGVTSAQAIGDILKAARTAFPRAIVTAQARSVNLEVPGLSFGFDLVPAWQRDPDGYWIPDTETGNWFPTNPKWHTEFMTAANDASDGKLKPIIKMTKHWNAKNLDLLRSFHVELACKRIIAEKGTSSWSYDIATVLSNMLSYAGQPMMDPVYGATRVDKPLSPSDLQPLIGRLRFDATNAIEALKLESGGAHSQAIKMWQQIFVSGF